MFITSASASIIAKSTFERWFISVSKRPILVRGYREFIFARVSLPVNTTMPSKWPAARTVFAHAVLSRFRDYFFPCSLL
jgi:hypothetical protein